VKLPDTSRIRSRLYAELVEDALQMRGWTKAELAERASEVAQDLGMDLTVSAEQVYQYLERPRDARAGFAKLIEWTLGINLPPSCYLNAGKRAA